MKIRITSLFGSLYILFSVFHFSCKDNNDNEVPTVSTSEITNIGASSATGGGNISSDGGAIITEKGVCWSLDESPTVSDSKTIDGDGLGQFTSILTGLISGSTYYVKAFGTNSQGTGYGNAVSFETISQTSHSQIIADHSIVDKFDDIPSEYIAEIKKMWLSYAGESHSQAIRTGLLELNTAYPSYAVSVTEYGEPESYTTAHLRANRTTWGDFDNESGWVNNYGEEDWWTNSTAITRTKAGIAYCNTHNLNLAAIGFGWCWDAYWYENVSSGVDPVTGNQWFGTSIGGPSGDKCWGIDAEDNIVTDNEVNLETYLAATQAYIDYCAVNEYITKVFFTTGPVDPIYSKQSEYQAYLKYQRIRDYVKADTSRILFDYADILCYDDGSEISNTSSWNGNTFPAITAANLGDGSIGHIGSAGSVRLAKAIWWMLARMAGWNGN